MCGIVGYIGKRQACPILLKGLSRLEYRGYDSAGVALINDNGNLVIYKTKGKVADLERAIDGKDVSGSVGIVTYDIENLWETNSKKAKVGTTKKALKVTVPGHDVAMYRLTPNQKKK